MSGPERRLVSTAMRMARMSHCAKSKRGVAIGIGEDVRGGGFNSPPEPFACTRDDACRAHCRQLAVHAEERALLDAGSRRMGIRGCDLVHVKVDRESGTLLESGAPSCAQCSRLILEAGIDRVWLYQETGWESWSAVDFHQATLESCGLPGISYRGVDRGSETQR